MKTICVPNSTKAMDRLDFDACVEGDLIELELSEQEFKDLWDSGIFHELNRSLSILIDDYEDEQITGNLIGRATLILEDFIKKEKEPRYLLLEINKLLDIAKKSGTGVFFYF